MTFPAILLLAVGLALDAMAVAAARGLSAQRVLPRHALRVALLFGGFQGGMPLLGWAIGAGLGALATRFGHLIACAIFLAMGGKMLWEALQGGHVEESEPAEPERDVFEIHTLLALALATSIDAFAAGVTLPVLGAPLVLSVFTIGATTAILSAIGLYTGRHFGSRLGRRLDALGGLLLIGLAIRTLFDHIGS